jgi:TRAP transporter TAXI family solute receptor
MTRKLFYGLMVISVITGFLCGEIANAEQHPKFKVQILTTPMGAGAYYVGFKWAEIVNRKRFWLEAEAIEGMSSTTNIKLIMKEPERRKNTIFNSNNISASFARNALPPFTKKYQDVLGSQLQAISGQYSLLCPFITLDPSIKTVHDLVGKRVVMGPKGMVAGLVNRYILEQQGLWDKVKPQYMGFKPSATALGDGLVDAIVALVTVAGPGKYSVNPAFAELTTTKTVHLVHGGDPKIMLKAGERRGIEITPVNLSGEFQGRRIPQPMNTFYLGVEWCVDETMDEEVVYEMTKLLYENIDEIKKVHPSLKVVTKESLPNVSLEKYFHRGARRFYNEVGLKVGFQGLD